jgi:hypothetical protein
MLDCNTFEVRGLDFIYALGPDQWADMGTMPFEILALQAARLEREDASHRCTLTPIRPISP